MLRPCMLARQHRHGMRCMASLSAHLIRLKMMGLHCCASSCSRSTGIGGLHYVSMHLDAEYWLFMRVCLACA